jgi:hypothetical protein
MSDIVIKITGPGLVVNGPSIIVLKALRDIGFKVECEDWRGKDQWQRTEIENLEFIKSIANQIKVKVNVNPVPWGG